MVGGIVGVRRRGLLGMRELRKDLESLWKEESATEAEECDEVLGGGIGVIGRWR